MRGSPHNADLDRLWAAVERLRGRARGGYRTFNEATEEYEQLLAEIRATARHPVHVVAEAAGLPSSTIRELRRRAT